MNSQINTFIAFHLIRKKLSWPKNAQKFLLSFLVLKIGKKKKDSLNQERKAFRNNIVVFLKE